jgi:hypothetical protein
VSLPPHSWSTLAASFARNTGSRVGPRSTFVISSIACAATRDRREEGHVVFRLQPVVAAGSLTVHHDRPRGKDAFEPFAELGRKGLTQRSDIGRVHLHHRLAGDLP